MKLIKYIFLILSCVMFLFLGSIVEAQTEADENVRTFLNNLEDAVDKMDTYRFITLSENWKET